MDNLIVEYFNKCRNFDWFYDYSDDYRVYSSGRSAMDELIKEYENNPALKPIFDAWHIYNFSGEHFDIAQQPLPVITDYV